MGKRSKRRAANAGIALDQSEQRTPEQDAQKEARATFRHWMDEIEDAQKKFKTYFDRGKRIVRIYKDDRTRIEGNDAFKANHRLNILWSNVSTLQPALYSRTPTPNASRRFLDRDPTSRIAALILERCLMTAVDLCDFDYPMKRSRDDYLLVARGTSWVRYTPEFGPVKLQEPVTAIQLQGTDRTVYRPTKGGDEVPGDQVKEDEDGLSYYEVEEEGVLAHGMTVDHVLWSDFLHEPVNDWTKCGWIAKRVAMKRPQLIKEFGKDVGRKVVLNKTLLTKNEGGSDTGGETKKSNQADVWEIWCKNQRDTIWISDGYQDGPLKVEKDPLRLSDFWPAPRPLLGTTSTDSLIPVPDYALYQDQAEQLDKLTDRIRLLIQALRVVGMFNAESADLSLLLNEGDENEMIPVANWIAFAQAGGMKGNIDWLPIEQIQAVLMGLFNARAAIKQDLYEITGISDIIRGATAPEETATAQQIKANFGNLRLQDRQSEMARFARDTLRKMGEIQCEHYPAEVLIEMSGVRELDEFRIPPVKPANPQDPQDVARFQAETAAAQAKQADNEQKIMAAVQLLKSDKLRSFKIDLETDATVAPDQQKEKETRVEFLTAVAPFIEKAAMVGMQAPQLVPLLMKMLEFGVRGFRTGRTLESAIEETISLAEQMQQQAQQAPEGEQLPADPVAEANAAKLKAESDKMGAELQKLQGEIAAQKAESEAKIVENQRRAQEAREKFAKDMLKLTEEIQFRRDEHAKRCAELDASIRLKELQIQQIQNNDGLKELQAMLPQEQPEATPLQKAQDTAALAKSQFELVELQKKYAELVAQSTGLEGVSQALDGVGNVLPSQLGAPVFAKPKKRTKKMHGFIYDEDPQSPRFGRVIGGTTDEVEIDDEPEEQAA